MSDTTARRAFHERLERQLRRGSGQGFDIFSYAKNPASVTRQQIDDGIGVKSGSGSVGEFLVVLEKAG